MAVNHQNQKCSQWKSEIEVYGLNQM